MIEASPIGCVFIGPAMGFLSGIYDNSLLPEFVQRGADLSARASFHVSSYRVVTTLFSSSPKRTNTYFALKRVMTPCTAFASL